MSTGAMGLGKMPITVKITEVANKFISTSEFNKMSVV